MKKLTIALALIASFGAQARDFTPSLEKKFNAMMVKQIGSGIDFGDGTTLTKATYEMQGSQLVIRRYLSVPLEKPNLNPEQKTALNNHLRSHFSERCKAEKGTTGLLTTMDNVHEIKFIENFTYADGKSEHVWGTCG